MEINNILETEDREVFMTLSQTYQEWKEATKREGRRAQPTESQSSSNSYRSSSRSVLKNSPSHRWSAVEDVLLRLLKHWNSISNAFNEIRTEFPIKNEKRVLIELRSIIHPVRHIQTVAQRTKQLVVFQVYLLMMQLYFGLLNKHNAMDLYDPSQTHLLQETTTPEVTSNPLDKLQPTSTVPSKDLDE